MLREYRSFKQARAFARDLGLKSWVEWREYCKSGSKPANIPAHPFRTYAEAGWVSMGDWLGTNKRRRGADWRPFNKARAFVRGIGLKSTTGWGEYCHSGKRPADIPANPSSVYANDGWVGYSDWLGNGRVPRDGYRSFKEARAFVRARRLKTEAEWREYCRSGNKPADIPAGPSSVYSSDGWVGWGDWLGTGRVAHGGQRSFKEAVLSFDALALNPVMNGSTIAGQARDLATFLPIRTRHTREPVGPGWPTGLVPARSLSAYTSIDLSRSARVRLRSRAELSILNGESIASPHEHQKARTGFATGPRRRRPG